MQQQLGDQVTFLGLPSRSDDIASMAAFVEDNALGNFEHLIDAEGAIWSELEIVDQPAFAFVNDDVSIDTFIGSFEEEELAARVQTLIDS